MFSTIECNWSFATYRSCNLHLSVPYDILHCSNYERNVKVEPINISLSGLSMFYFDS